MTANIRIFLWALLGLAVLLNVNTWFKDFPPASAVAGTQAVAAGSAPAPSAATLDTVPVASTPAASGSPATASAATVAATPATAAPAGGAVAGEVADAGVVHVVTDVLDLDISLQGGQLTRADLLAYPLVKNQPTLVRLLDTAADDLSLLQTGLAGANGASAPTHQALFTSEAKQVRMAAGQDTLDVPLTWSDGKGVTVTKVFHFRRGRYAIGLEYQIRNAGASPWSYAPYAQLLRNNPPVARSYFNSASNAFRGPAFYNGTKYQKLNTFSSTPPVLDQDITNGWFAGMQHHFVVAAVPDASVAYHYHLKTQGTQYLISAEAGSQSVAPGATADVKQSLFVGPKLQAQLKTTGPNLERVADYGALTIIAQPLFSLLNIVHNVLGNWGFTIIVVTFLLKLLFYPLSEASGRSMAKMKALQPRIKNLQETYKDQRDQLGKAMMELYQREKVNPLAGCLPMVIQIPVFLAFYWVLLESVEMRQAPFIGWINDLSSRDPYFILPAIMMGAMFAQYRLNPQMGDAMQQKIMMIMPLAMSVMFAFFPAGLVLYWVTNTLLSILQQWNINRRVNLSAAKART
ncbi:MAG TPA: membrane protein insertase YidC [Steroidobacteraceae bacterium]|nr:membrane protein insertase YidC [Steroidobacteraceae bacterium]